MGNLVAEEVRQTFKPEIMWFKRQLRIRIPSGIKKIIIICLLSISLVSNIFTAVGIKSGALNINMNVFKKTFSNSFGIQQNGNNNSVVLSVATQCLSRYCSDFKDGNWLGIDKFTEVQQDPLVLKSPDSIKLPGATMFYKEPVGNFTAKVFLTPQATTSANLVLSYGHFYRCILGDFDYELITCQINQAYPTVPENWSYFDKDGVTYGKNKHYQKRPFEQGKELEIKFEQKDNGDNTIISIKINNQVPVEWALPKKFQKLTLLEQIGLGLITTKYDDAKAIFKHFELQPQM